MKDKIIAYGKEYIDNFKQNPLSATAVLTIQIIFILGWGVYFYYILGNIITIVSGEFSIARFIPRFSDNVPTAFWAVQEGENK